MKTVGVMLAATLFASVVSRGQGQFYFNNRIAGELDERIYSFTDAPGVSSVGTQDWWVLLLGGPVGTPVAGLVPLEPPSTAFLGPPGSTLAGYVVGVTPTVPDVPPGQAAIVVVRIVGPGGASSDQGPFLTGPLGGGGIPIPTLPFTFVLVPEPTTPALAFMALAVFLVARVVRSFSNANVVRRT